MFELERIPAIKRGNLIVDPQCCTVTLEGRTIYLYPKEFDVLYLLVSHAGWVLTPEQIYQSVWQEETLECEYIIYNTICQIRKKLGYSDMIQTVRDHGYKFVG
ncbi:MAG: winged helix-turn-helix domain-containing protein [Butyrivibrio sp.]|nr:winged helix-turn-helix domain-containing protein [Butyrivibrio sp.]